MALAERTSALRQVSQLLCAGTSLGISDRDLLAQFLDREGEARDLAFAALIERHGPMVHRVCRTILRDSNAADDAFQATFLVLVRRARSIWLETRSVRGSIKWRTAWRRAHGQQRLGGGGTSERPRGRLISWCGIGRPMTSGT